MIGLRPLPTAVLACVTLWLAGCGQDEYLSRLAQTKDYYAHLEMLDEKLAPATGFAGQQVVVRVPKQYRLIPIPTQADVDAAFAAGAPDPLDHLHPTYLGLKLPGLVGAWAATVSTNVQGTEEDRPSYLYLATNAHLSGQAFTLSDAEREQLQNSVYEADQEPDFATSELLDHIEYRLAGALAVEIPEGVSVPSGAGDPANTRFEVGYPSSRYQPYHLSKSVVEIDFRPQRAIDAFDVVYQIHLYEIAPPGGSTQVAILLVVPEGIDPREQLDDRIELMLATLKVGGSSSRPMSGF